MSDRVEETAEVAVGKKRCASALARRQVPLRGRWVVTWADRPYSLGEAALALQCAKTTVAWWLAHGELEELPVRGNVRLVAAPSLRALAERRGIVLQEAGTKTEGGEG